MSGSDTASELLDAAQHLIQERGYNAFSYKDLSGQVGIRTASIHYHFPSKADLGQALMERYLVDLTGALERIEAKAKTAKARLQGFFALYGATESQGSICLCGSLASDRETLPEPLQEAVGDYLSKSEKWIAKAISDGLAAGEFEPGAKPADQAGALLAALQGGLMLSRARDGKPILQAVQRSFFSALGAR